MNQRLRLSFFIVLAAALAGGSLRAQPEELVGIRLGQDIHELKKTYSYRMRQVLRSSTDQALQSCGMQTYEMEHDGERLELTSIKGRVVKIDLSKDLAAVDPTAMAAQFVAGFGAPRKVACKLDDGPTEVRSLLSECGRKQTYVELEYGRGEKAESENAITLRVRLRAATRGFSKGHSRVTLARGWESRVAKLAECSQEASEELKRSVVEGAPDNIPLGLRKRFSGWWDPSTDPGWITIYYPYDDDW